MGKRILLITPMLHQGGFEKVCVMTARLLKEKGFEVVIAVFSMEDAFYDVSGLEVVNLHLEAKNGKIRKAVNIVRRCFKLSSLQKKMKADVSYSFGMTANIANALSFGAKKKITACHSFGEINNRCYMKLIGRCSHQVFCCSEKIAALVKQNYHFKNVQALWNPYNISEIIRQSGEEPDQNIAFFDTEDKILVSMGREDDVKGYWHLLKIFQRVHEKNEKTKLAIIGEGAFTEYKKLAQELGIADRVLFTGLKKNPFPYLKRSSIYVLTSISEGLPNALIEALTLSLPVVSANCLSGPAEILHGNFTEAEMQKEIFRGDYGILVPALNPQKEMSVRRREDGGICPEKEEESFARAVLELLEDEKLYEAYREKGAERAKAFSSDSYLEKLLSCLDKL